MEIKRLIDILTDGYILEDKEAIIEICEEGHKNPMEYATNNDLMWLLETKEDAILDVLLPLELSQIVIRGDKIDEIHEQLSELIENLPDFPYKPHEKKITTKQYFEWIEPYLGDNNELLLLGDSICEDLLIFLVYKEDVEEIFQLTKKLNIQCYKPTTYLY